MAKGIYTAVGGLTKKVKKAYAVVDGKTRKIKKAYTVIGGKTRLAWSGTLLKEIEYGHSSTGFYTTTTENFASFSTPVTSSPTTYDSNGVFYRQGYIYRLIATVAVTGQTHRRSVIQRKKIGATSWENVLVLQSQSNTGYYMTYNQYEDKTTLTQIENCYNIATYSSSGTFTISYKIVDGVNFSSGTWTKLTDISSGSSETYNTSYFFGQSASNFYFLGTSATYGSLYYKVHCKNGSNDTYTYTDSNSSLPLFMQHMLYFNGKYFGSGTSNNSYKAASFKLSGSTPTSVTEYKLSGRVNDDPIRFFIHNNVLYRIEIEYSSTNKTNTITIYKSTDGNTFTTVNTLTTQILTDTYASTAVYIGEDSDNWNYVLYQNNSGIKSSLVSISKSNGNITYTSTTTGISSYVRWGVTEQ